MKVNGNKPTRIVTNGEYVREHSKRAGLRGWGLLLFILGFLFALFATFVIVFAVADEHRVIYESFGSFCINATIAYLLFRQGGVNMRQAEQIQPGTPLSRVNIAHLPAVGSLVRASQEPADVQKALLLRESLEEQNTPAEQLVRPSGKQE